MKCKRQNDDNHNGNENDPKQNELKKIEELFITFLSS